jgi:hypothetical protein
MRIGMFNEGRVVGEEDKFGLLRNRIVVIKGEVIAFEFVIGDKR